MAAAMRNLHVGSLLRLLLKSFHDFLISFQRHHPGRVEKTHILLISAKQLKSLWEERNVGRERQVAPLPRTTSANLLLEGPLQFLERPDSR